MYGVMTPQHLNRLGLVNDTVLYTSNQPDDIDGIEIEPFDYLGIDESFDSEIQDDARVDEKTIDEIESIEVKNYIQDLNIEDQDKIDDKKEIPLQISTDDILMLKIALNKLPQISFSLLLDEYRWIYFEGKLNEEALNDEFWAMALELQGIAPPGDRDEVYFDVGAKFHVPDNTPYIR